jgi:hypothetical protein
MGYFRTHPSIIRGESYPQKSSGDCCCARRSHRIAKRRIPYYAKKAFAAAGSEVDKFLATFCVLAGKLSKVELNGICSNMLKESTEADLETKQGMVMLATVVHTMDPVTRLMVLLNIIN